MPMTFAPYILPIWHAKEPTEPAAPDTTSVSPALISATPNKPFLQHQQRSDKLIVELDNVQSMPTSPLKGQISPGSTGDVEKGTYGRLEVPKTRATECPEER